MAPPNNLVGNREKSWPSKRSAKKVKTPGFFTMDSSNLSTTDSMSSSPPVVLSMSDDGLISSSLTGASDMSTAGPNGVQHSPP